MNAAVLAEFARLPTNTSVSSNIHLPLQILDQGCTTA